MNFPFFREQANLENQNATNGRFLITDNCIPTAFNLFFGPFIPLVLYQLFCDRDSYRMIDVT